MERNVTVVAGVPRSGTSLLMQMLDAGGHPVLVDDERPPDAHNPRGYFEFAPAKALDRDASWLPRAVGRAVKIVHVLVPRLPEGYAYDVVLLRRDLREVVASQDVMLAATGGAPQGPATPRLEDIFARQLAEVEAWLHASRGFRVLPVEHARALAEPRAVAAALAGFLERPLDETAMAAAVDPALYRQREAQAETKAPKSARR